MDELTDGHKKITAQRKGRTNEMTNVQTSGQIDARTDEQTFVKQFADNDRQTDRQTHTASTDPFGSIEMHPYKVSAC